MVDEQVHDSLGDLVGDGLAHDVEVGRDEPADEVCLEGFAFRQGGVGRVGVRLWHDVSMSFFIRDYLMRGTVDHCDVCLLSCDTYE